jgi:hypothetical protein
MQCRSGGTQQRSVKIRPPAAGVELISCSHGREFNEYYSAGFVKGK